MAVKKKTETKKSKLWEMLLTESKWENYVFSVLTLATLILGLLILNGILTVRPDFPVLGLRPTFFAWVIVIGSAAGLIYAIFPSFQKAWPEFKKVTWPTLRVFFGNTSRVFFFLISLALLFIAYDVIITNLLAKIM